jgi:hypothetical protein
MCAAAMVTFREAAGYRCRVIESRQKLRHFSTQVEVASWAKPVTEGSLHEESGRDAHLAGEVAKALMAKAPDLFSMPPKIEKADVLASKLG